MTLNLPIITQWGSMLGMRIVADIDVLGDASVQRKVARLSLALLAACAVAVLALALASE